MPGDAADKMVAAAPPLAAGPGGCGEAGAAGALPDAARWRPRPGRDRVEGALVEGKGRAARGREGKGRSWKGRSWREGKGCAAARAGRAPSLCHCSHECRGRGLPGPGAPKTTAVPSE